MTLRGVTQKDSGVYHCEVTARQDKIKLGEVTVTLNVLGGNKNLLKFSILSFSCAIAPTICLTLSLKHNLSISEQYDHVMQLCLTWTVAPHAPLCEVPETVMKGFSAELRCKDKLSVPAATYSWYKDNKPLHTANLPEINYTLDPKTGTLVGLVL